MQCLLGLYLVIGLYLKSCLRSVLLSQLMQVESLIIIILEPVSHL